MVEQIELLLEENDIELLREHLNNLNISDVEALIDELPDHGPLFIEILSPNRAVNVFRILDFPKQERIIKKLSGAKIAELINLLPPDDRTALFSELHGDAVKTLIVHLPAADRKEALTLLGYNEDSVGRLMTPDYITVKKTWTVNRVLEHLRKYGKNSETIDVLYVIDSNGVLVDDIRIREILLVDPETKVSALMDNRLIALNVNDPQQEAGMRREVERQGHRSQSHQGETRQRGAPEAGGERAVPDLEGAEEQEGGLPVDADQGGARRDQPHRRLRRLGIRQEQRHRSTEQRDAERSPAPGPGGQVGPPVETMERHQHQGHDERANGLREVARENHEL